MGSWVCKTQNKHGDAGNLRFVILMVDAIISNGAFQNRQCNICFSSDLDKAETGYNLLMV